MYRVAVIGSGQLGSRHLQGLAGIPGTVRLYMVDPSPAALEESRRRIAEVSAEAAAGAIACASVAELPRELDLTIIATSAATRFGALEALLGHSAVAYVVLEKVLFNREDEYRRASELLADAHTTAWVNCPRRAYPVYAELRGLLGRVRLLEVSGAGWGLACNAIHFADLVQYLSGAVLERYDASGLGGEAFPSRRQGFVEFNGTLVGRTHGIELRMTDAAGAPMRHLITVRGDTRSCVIDEQAGRGWLLDEQTGWREIAFEVPYQSALTGPVAREILEQGTSPLTPYALSAAIHLPFVQCLNAHYAHSTGGTVLACPVT